MRKAWFGNNKLPDISSLTSAVHEEVCFKNLHNTKTAKQTIRKMLTDWSNFRKALNAYKKDKSKFFKMPKPVLDLDLWLCDATGRYFLLKPKIM